eukprot:2182953-Amphidinium_carterae.1
MTSVRFAQWLHWCHHDRDKLGALGVSMSCVFSASPRARASVKPGWRGGGVPEAQLPDVCWPHPGSGAYCLTFSSSSASNDHRGSGAIKPGRRGGGVSRGSASGRRLPRPGRACVP